MNRKLVVLAAALVSAALAIWWSGRDRNIEVAKPVATGSGSAAQPTPAPERRDGNANLGRSGDVQIDDDPKGALRLEGQVVDADDHPVKGAIVVLSSNPPRTDTTEED